jgi:hypothetical protein
MNDALLSAVFRALDLGVIERRRDSAFYMVTTPPDWLSQAFASAISDTPGRIDGAMPFLDHFMHQAEAIWREGPPAMISSGPFVATIRREEILINARAMTVQDRQVLVLERLTGDADTRPILQKAREQMLVHEQLVRRIATVHEPAAAIDGGLKQLLAASLPPDQRAIVESIASASVEVQAALAKLPSLPSRFRRHARKKD